MPRQACQDIMHSGGADRHLHSAGSRKLAPRCRPDRTNVQVYGRLRLETPAHRKYCSGSARYIVVLASWTASRCDLRLVLGLVKWNRLHMELDFPTLLAGPMTAAAEAQEADVSLSENLHIKLLDVRLGAYTPLALPPDWLPPRASRPPSHGTTFAFLVVENLKRSSNLHPRPPATPPETAKMSIENEACPSYSQFACIGSGFSAIGLGATLKRWHGITDVQFFERHDNLGGTWYANSYPGCACDVPSALYSFSFEPNPNWSRITPSNEELWAYLKRTSDKNDLTSKMTFGATVEQAVWIEERKRWRLQIRRNDGTTILHECQFLFSGVGHLTEPRELDAPGVETFQGDIFHSARWRSDVDLTDKKVVVIGNGCTACQIVPEIVQKTKHLTQIARSKHWVMPPIDAGNTKALQLLLNYMPGMMALQRFIIFCLTENSFRGFYMTSAGARFRKSRRAKAERYMRRTAPAKYHDMLIPEFEIGCKRRIFDSGYLKSLHEENLTLTNSPIEEVTEKGVRTRDGLVEADVVVLANGFTTNELLAGIDIVGRGGKTIPEHWGKFGGPEAYNCTSLNGFPNFFMVLGTFPLYPITLFPSPPHRYQ